MIPGFMSIGLSNEDLSKEKSQIPTTLRVDWGFLGLVFCWFVFGFFFSGRNPKY